MKKAKTHEQFVNEVKSKYPDFEVLSFYINNKTSVKIHDTKCGYEWSILPRDLLRSSRKEACPNCYRLNLSIKRATPLDAVIAEIEEKYPGLFEYITGYINKGLKCWWRCKICGNEWETSPHDILAGHGCPICKRKKANQKLITSLEKFLIQLKEIWGDKIEYIEGYIKMSTKCKFRCTTCGHIWETTPSSLLQYHGCPKCGYKIVSNKLKTSLEDFLQKLKEIWNGLIEYIEGYESFSKKCKFRCTVCGHEWYATPDKIINQRKGCYECWKVKMSKEKIIPLDEFLRRLKEVWGNDIIYISGYKNMNTKCLVKCTICGFCWEVIPYNLLNLSGCPSCTKKCMEKPIMDLLTKKGIIPKHDLGFEGSNYKGSKSPLRPDFLIEDKKGTKLCIECDGRQHFEPIFGEKELKHQKELDEHKNKILKENGYIVLRIKNSNKWGTNKHVLLQDAVNLLEIGIDNKTKEIDYNLFKKYDFNEN